LPEQLDALGEDIEEIVVSTITLDNVLNSLSQKPGFLKIDVEGFERRIFGSWSSSFNRPNIMVIEGSEEYVRDLMDENEYGCVFFDGINSYFADIECYEILRKQLKPLNVIDHTKLHLSYAHFLNRPLLSERDSLLSERDSLLSERDSLLSERDSLLSERDSLLSERDSLLSERDSLLSERDSLLSERDSLLSERDSLLSERDSLLSERDSLLSERDSLLSERDSLLSERDSLLSERDSLLSERQSMTIIKLVKNDIKSLTVELKRLLSGANSQKITLRYLIYLKTFKKSPKLTRLTWSVNEIDTKSNSTKIALDAFQIVPGVSGGVETYLAMIIASLKKTEYQPILLCHPINSKDLIERFGKHANIATIQFAKTLTFLSKKKSLKSKFTVLARNAVSFSGLEQALSVSLLHSPVQIFTTLDFNIPSILNLHDMQHKYFPENFSKGDLEARDIFYLQSSLAASKIIVSSDYVAQDIVAFLDVEKKKIVKIDVAWDMDFFEALKNPKKPESVTSKNFLFYPANFWPHKNHILLLELFAKNKSYLASHGVDLIFTGGRSTLAIDKMKNIIESYSLQEQVHVLGHTNLNELAWLYINSLATVVPSLFEASSFPIIEAQLSGSVVLAARTTSLPELLRDGAGITFDPQNLLDLEERIYDLLDGKYDLSKIKENALKRVTRENSLESYAENLCNLYDELMKIKGKER
jgi:glycosyltransferase involved in cell wall biosynthesis